MNNEREEFKGELVAVLLQSTAVGKPQATEWAELVDQILWSLGGASCSELFDQLIDKFQMWLIGQMQQQESLLDIDLETIHNFLLTASYNLCRGVSHKTNDSSTTTAGLPQPLASSSSSPAGELIARQKAELAISEAADRAKEKAKQEGLEAEKQMEERNEEGPEARRARLLRPLHRLLSAAPSPAPPLVSSSSFGIQGLCTPPLSSIQDHSSSSPHSGPSQGSLERKTCAPATPNNRDIKQQVNICDSLKL